MPCVWWSALVDQPSLTRHTGEKNQAGITERAERRRERPPAGIGKGSETGSFRSPKGAELGGASTDGESAGPPFLGRRSIFRPVRFGPLPGMLDRRQIRGCLAQLLHSRQCIHPFAPGLHNREPRVHRLALAIAPE